MSEPDRERARLVISLDDLDEPAAPAAAPPVMPPAPPPVMPAQAAAPPPGPVVTPPQTFPSVEGVQRAPLRVSGPQTPAPLSRPAGTSLNITNTHARNAL